MKVILTKLIKSIPFIGKWKINSEKYFALHAEPGKYNSPIVTWNEVLENNYYKTGLNTELKNINLNSDFQFDLLKEFESYSMIFPFQASKNNTHRYFYDNPMFAYIDGFFLFCFLNKFKPNRIIEIGSGYSSALMIDTFEMNQSKVEMTFIDPYTDRVDGLLSNSDFLVSKYMRIPVQKVDTDIYSNLKENDILFIDSSHIVKTAGDLNYIFFEILPLLNSGVIIHVHDIFFPFEYPEEWLKLGLCYNEAYFLRSFLMNNTNYEILFWNDYVLQNQPDFFKNKTAQTKARGGSFWMRKKKHNV